MPLVKITLRKVIYQHFIDIVLTIVIVKNDKVEYKGSDSEVPIQNKF